MDFADLFDLRFFHGSRLLGRTRDAARNWDTLRQILSKPGMCHDCLADLSSALTFGVANWRFESLEVEYNFETPYLEGSRVEQLGTLLKLLAHDAETDERHLRVGMANRVHCPDLMKS